MTHAELVACASRWLRSQRCKLILTETGSWLTQTHDAIGWTYYGHSIVIECKCSVADFRRDKYKTSPPHCGRVKYYLSEPGVLASVEMPSGCGLLEATATRTRVVRKAEWHWSHRPENEIPLLVAELRRVMLGIPRPNLIVEPDEQGAA